MAQASVAVATGSTAPVGVSPARNQGLRHLVYAADVAVSSLRSRPKLWVPSAVHPKLQGEAKSSIAATIQVLVMEVAVIEEVSQPWQGAARVLISQTGLWRFSTQRPDRRRRPNLRGQVCEVAPWHELLEVSQALGLISQLQPGWCSLVAAKQRHCPLSPGLRLEFPCTRSLYRNDWCHCNDAFGDCGPQ